MKIYYVTGIDIFNEDFIEDCASFFPDWRKDKMLQYKHLKGRVQNGLAYLLLIKALTSACVNMRSPCDPFPLAFPCSAGFPSCCAV